MQSYQFEQFVFDPADGRLARIDGAGEEHLRPQAGSLLQCLLEHPQTVVGRETLFREIWGEDAVVDFDSGLAALLREVRQAVQRLGAHPQLIETVPRRGYRLNADVGRITGGATAIDNRPGHAVWIVTAVLILAAAFAGSVWWRSDAPPAAADGPHQLAILPLERFGEPGLQPQRAEILLADSVLAALWRAELEGLELIGRAGMRPYAGRDDVVAAVAADLGVNLLIEGSILAEPERWQVELRLLAVPGARVIWSQTLGGNDPVMPVSDIASTLVDRLGEDWQRLRGSLNSE